MSPFGKWESGNITFDIPKKPSTGNGPIPSGNYTSKQVTKKFSIFLKPKTFYKTNFNNSVST